MLDSIYIRSTLSQPHCRSTDAFGIEDFEYISSYYQDHCWTLL